MSEKRVSSTIPVTDAKPAFPPTVTGLVWLVTPGVSSNAVVSANSAPSRKIDARSALAENSLSYTAAMWCQPAARFVVLERSFWQNIAAQAQKRKKIASVVAVL